MIIAVIPAKKDSSRLPNKNMALVNGKPMIYYSIKDAKECPQIDDIYVSTDSDEIESYAKQHDVKIIRRGPELCGDIPIVKVYEHALQNIQERNVQYIVGIQVDHPDRKTNLTEAINYILEKKFDEIITVDKNGTLNGSLKIMDVKALVNGKIGAVGTIMDDCTNIHYVEDLEVAEKNIQQWEKH